ncbi:unnamed protein product, partial [Ectocarpus sp. 12 AP-2014]
TIALQQRKTPRRFCRKRFRVRPQLSPGALFAPGIFHLSAVVHVCSIFALPQCFRCRNTYHMTYVLPTRYSKTGTIFPARRQPPQACSPSPCGGVKSHEEHLFGAGFAAL